MKEILLFIWQLPQHLIGLALIKLLGAKPKVWRQTINNYDIDIPYWHFERNGWFSKFLSGGSFGQYILLPECNDLIRTVPHERGHSIQSEYLGLLYLIIIGIPSVIGNLLSRVFIEVQENYYRLPWEKWADTLGGVDRKGGEQ